MKKIITLSILLCTFFLLPRVNADTHNVSFNTSYYDLLHNSNFVPLLSDLTTASPYYVIALNSSGSYYYSSIYLDTIADYDCVWNTGKMQCKNTRSVTKNIFDPATFSVTGTQSQALTNYHFSTSGMIYSTNIPLVVTNGDTYNITDGTYTYSCTGTSSTPCAIPDLLTFYNLYYSPPIGVDNYPLLTQFYTLVIEKISFLAEYVSSNYLFLSFLVISLFISIFLLIKRRV